MAGLCTTISVHSYRGPHASTWAMARMPTTMSRLTGTSASVTSIVPRPCLGPFLIGDIRGVAVEAAGGLITNLTPSTNAAWPSRATCDTGQITEANRRE